MRALILALAACGGAAHPKPAFDAKALAADLDRVMADMARAAQTDGDCERLVHDLDAIVERGRDAIERAKQAQQDPVRAKQLTTELHAYDKIAAGRSDAIIAKVSVCVREHPELKDGFEAVFLSLPTL